MTYRITYREDAEGHSILQYSGDAQALVDACAAEARANRETSMPLAKRGMRKTMSLDPVVLMDIAHKNGLSYFDPAVFEIAKDRDYSKFRTIEDKRYFRSRRRKYVSLKPSR